MLHVTANAWDYTLNTKSLFAGMCLVVCAVLFGVLSSVKKGDLYELKRDLYPKYLSNPILFITPESAQRARETTPMKRKGVDAYNGSTSRPRMPVLSNSSTLETHGMGVQQFMHDQSLNKHISKNNASSYIHSDNFKNSVSEHKKTRNNIPMKLRRIRPKILDDFPKSFLSEYKNPCYIQDTDKILHCLPYFFLLGTPKSGTTDIWDKIVSHPDIAVVTKEPHWWTRSSYPSVPLSSYEKRYMTRAITTQTKSMTQRKDVVITGDGSASTLWDNQQWETFFPNDLKTGPPYVMADVIHTVLPDAKLLVAFRDPTERLYSDYLYFHRSNVISVENFHQRVVRQIKIFQDCLSNRSLRACAYSSEDKATRLRIGLYSVYVRDWLQRYRRDQLMPILLEEWHTNCTTYLPKIYTFLEVASLPPSTIFQICRKKSKNTTRKKLRYGQMWNSTRKLLRDFYRPYVKDLASVLDDNIFLWDYFED